LALVPGAASYNASGHAVIGLTRSLRAELAGSGVKVQLLLVGPTDTDMLAGLHRPWLVRPRAAADVGELLVAVLESDRAEVTTARWSAALTTHLRALDLLLTRTWLRATGADRLLSEPDALARAAYQARIERR
jgi:short-subunit dehydrogenase